MDFKTASSKRKHEQGCTNNEQKVYHTCKSCGKTFTKSDNLKRHLQRHEGRRDHKCGSCGKAFFASSGLKKHVDTVHKGLKPYQCSFCNTAYGQNGDLKRHVKRCHTKEQEIIEEIANKQKL